MKRAASSMLLFALAVGACNSEEGPVLTVPSDPQAVVLSVQSVGGFAPPEFLLSRVPRFTLLADGTLISEGPQIMLFPGPFLPSLQTSRIDEETLQGVLEYVEGIGFPDIDLERNDEAALFIADAPDDVVTYFDEGGEHVFSVYGLTIYEQFTDARVVQLRDLVRLLENASFATTPTGDYRGEVVQVIAGVSEFPPEPAVANERPWPLPVSFDELDEVFGGWRCRTFAGAEAEALLSIFTSANQATTWDLDGVQYRLIGRPLLPGETGCATLNGSG
jgi:hypothetical protein